MKVSDKPPKLDRATSPSFVYIVIPQYLQADCNAYNLLSRFQQNESIIIEKLATMKSQIQYN